MKKLLSTVAFAAALFTGAAAVQAAPLLTLTVTTSGATDVPGPANDTGADTCAAFGGTFSGSTCTKTSTTGNVLFSTGGVAFGDWVLNDDEGTGANIFTPPGLWFDYKGATTTPGTTITVTLSAQNYYIPVGEFGLILSGSGTARQGMKVVLDGFFDAGNSAVAGSGTNVFSEVADGQFGLASFSNTLQVPVNNSAMDGLYSLSWIAVMSTYSDATFTQPTVAGGRATNDLNVPTPTPLALLGLGLAALALVSRRKLGQSAI